MCLSKFEHWAKDHGGKKDLQPLYFFFIKIVVLTLVAAIICRGMILKALNKQEEMKH